MSTATDRAERASANKFTDRRKELADSALAAIADQGFARTGLRDIAARSALSTGILHYYFADKDDLIAQAIWQYKSECARRYDPIVTTATTAKELVARFGEEMTATLRDEADMHRLWYDLRNQSLFDEGFRDTIIAIDGLLSDMVWAVVARYAELCGATPAIDPETAYALFDGVFLNTLIRHLRGDLTAVAELPQRTANLLAAAV